MDELKLFADPAYGYDQMEVIRVGIKKLGVEKVKLYLNPNFESSAMEEIYKGLEDENLSVEQVKLYAKEDLDVRIMYQLRRGLLYGMSEERIEKLANSKLDWEEIRNIVDSESKQDEKSYSEILLELLLS